MKHWLSLLGRAEALHHSIACAGQDSKDLSAASLRALLRSYIPSCTLWPFVDRASQVYNATVLMEVCRARGVTEARLTECAEVLLCEFGADPNGRSSASGCTPLIIAAARGMPKLVALLLACGADARPRGEGRFRLCGRSSSVAGCHDALAWTSVLLDAEAEVGVPERHRRDLRIVQRMLEIAAAQDDGAYPPATEDDGIDSPAALSAALPAARATLRAQALERVRCARARLKAT